MEWRRLQLQPRSLETQAAETTACSWSMDRTCCRSWLCIFFFFLRRAAACRSWLVTNGLAGQVFHGINGSPAEPPREARGRASASMRPAAAAAEHDRPAWWPPQPQPQHQMLLTFSFFLNPSLTPKLQGRFVSSPRKLSTHARRPNPSFGY